jgi:2-phospho-L-lactate guanylyltransferase
MRALLLPIKDLKNAKQRLAGTLTPEERFGLATAMLEDTVRAVKGVRFAQDIFVITNYEPAIRIAQENGWKILREERQISESDSVDTASRICVERGVTGLLRLPLDLPLVRSSDIDDLLTVECSAPALVIVPSRDGTGTNAILRTPPVLFPSHFGHGSFVKHLAEAECADAHVTIRRNERLEMDVDDESDLRVLFEHDLSGTQTGKWLDENGIAARFRATTFRGACIGAES